METIQQKGKGMWLNHMSLADTGIVLILFFAIVGLCERALYDIARFAIGSDSVDYFDDFGVIMVHTVFIMSFLASSLLVNLVVAEKREKYAVAIVPYFIASFTLTMQLSLQMGVYFYNHHTDLEFYLVMSALISICSYAIYFVQNRYNPETS